MALSWPKLQAVMAGAVHVNPSDVLPVVSAGADGASYGVVARTSADHSLSALAVAARTCTAYS